MALTASAPAKLILLGEWGVLDGHSALGVALEPRFHAALSLNEDGISDHLKSLQIESEKQLCNLSEHIPPSNIFFHWTAKVLKQLGVDGSQIPWAGQKIALQRDWPLSEGLGSSSALFLTLNTLVSGKIPALSEFTNLRARLLKLQDGLGSGFDMAIQLFGKTIHMQGFQPRYVDIEYPENLHLIHTGEKFSTSLLLKAGSGPQTADRKVLGKICDDFLDSRDWIEAIENSYHVLNHSGVVPASIHRQRAVWLKSGIIETLKTCGAGGGDTLLTVAKPGQLPKLAEACDALGWTLSHYAFNAPGVSLETA